MKGGTKMKRRELEKRVTVDGAAEDMHQTAAGGKWPSLTLRPDQLLCAVCSLGEDPTGRSVCYQIFKFRGGLKVRLGRGEYYFYPPHY